MARDGFDGLGKMRGGERNSSYIPKPHDSKPAREREAEPSKKLMQGNEGENDGEKIHEVHEHGDGTFHTEHPDGTKEEHPDHLHLLAHLGHHLTSGDKHHIVHHDGIAAHSHSIDEAGQHEDHGEHNTANEAREAMDKFLGEESEEPQHEHGEADEEEGPVMGGM
jgi:hypothetical protein